MILVSVKKHSPLEKNALWKMGSRSTSGVESSFCCGIAGQRLAQKECFFTDTGIMLYDADLFATPGATSLVESEGKGCFIIRGQGGHSQFPWFSSPEFACCGLLLSR